MEKVGKLYNVEFLFSEFLMGGIAYDKTGDPLPQATIDGVVKSDACLFGAIGGEKWDNLPRDKRPESGLLRFRKELEVFANLRPYESRCSKVQRQRWT